MAALSLWGPTAVNPARLIQINANASLPRSVKRSYGANPMQRRALELLQQGHGNMQRVLTLVRIQVDLLQGSGDLSGFALLSNAVDYMHNYPRFSHHPAEDMLFAKLKVRCSQASSSCDRLQEQHRWFGVQEHELLRLSRRAQAGDAHAYTALRQQANAYCDAHVDHTGREESEIFPLAQDTLRDADWQETLMSLQTNADPLMGPEVLRRYESLYDYLMDTKVARRYS